MKPITLAIISAIALATTGVAVADVSPPTDDSFRTTAETVIRNSLVDPDSAEFKWARAPIDATYVKAGAFASTIPGPLKYGCGRVNARNRMGGYVGYVWFEVAIRDGEVVLARMDSAEDEEGGVGGAVAYGCHGAGF